MADNDPKNMQKPKKGSGKNSSSDSDEEVTSVFQSETFKVRIAQAGKAPPSLVMLVGPAGGVGRQWPLEQSDIIVGRAPSSNIFVDDRSLSRSHAKLMLQAGEVSIIDLQSTNRTVVNGKELTPLVPCKLKNNDQIKLGNVILKFLEQGNIETVSVAQTFGRGLTDALTGIHNRGALESYAAEQFNRANLLGVPYTLVMLDIDYFKKVNDTYGHAAGDFVLKEVARVIRDGLIRGDDFLARFGGEEFCLVLMGSSVKQAEDIASRVRATIQNHKFMFEDKEIPITISGGVATKTDADKEWATVMSRADTALYQSKNAGRNRITLAGG